MMSGNFAGEEGSGAVFTGAVRLFSYDYQGGNLIGLNYLACFGNISCNTVLTATYCALLCAFSKER